MRKYMAGFALGVIVSITGAAYANEMIQVLKSNATINFKGHDLNLADSGYEVLNYEGNNYVPIRFIAETLNIPIFYNSDSDKVVLGSEEAIDLKSLLNCDFKNIEYINVTYGDGIRRRIESKEDIQKITSRLDKLTLKLSKQQEYLFGYLYSLELVTKDKKINFSSNLEINDVHYEGNSTTEELIAIMLALKPQS